MVYLCGFTDKTYVQKIYLTQKKIIKVMTFSEKTDHSNALFSRLEFLKVDDIHQFQLLAFVYDCQNRLVPAQFHDFLYLVLKFIVLTPI